MIWHKLTEGMTALEKVTCIFIIIGVVANISNILHHW